MAHAPFALLDDCGATSGRPSSRLYRGFVREHRCTDPTTLDAVMAAAELSFADVLRATFPCGSITGAPKVQTMKLIAALESTPRGLYTGSIGWLDSAHGGRRCGDFCLSVAIRTMTLGADAGGHRAARLGVGAGIVLDSDAESELAECRLKARFATTLLAGPDPSSTVENGPHGGGWPAEDRQSCELSVV